MKKLVIMTVLISTFGSFSNESNAKETKNASQEFADKLLKALQKSSSFSYSELIPSIGELHGLMKENKQLYGPFLQKATADMTDEYVHNFLPSIEKAFNGVIAEGTNRGVEWSTIRLVTVESDGAEGQVPTYFTIVISSQGKQYKIRLENAFFVNGEFRVNQYIRFI